MSTINALSVVKEFFISRSREDQSEHGYGHRAGGDLFVCSGQPEASNATPLTPLSDEQPSAVAPDALSPIDADTQNRVRQQIETLVADGDLSPSEMIQRLATLMRELEPDASAVDGENLGSVLVPGDAAGSVLVGTESASNPDIVGSDEAPEKVPFDALPRGSVLIGMDDPIPPRSEVDWTHPSSIEAAFDGNVPPSPFHRMTWTNGTNTVGVPRPLPEPFVQRNAVGRIIDTLRLPPSESQKILDGARAAAIDGTFDSYLEGLQAQHPASADAIAVLPQDHLTPEQQLQATKIASELAHLEYVRHDWPARNTDPGATERLRQEVLDAAGTAAAEGPLDLEALGEELVAQAYPPRFTEIFGQRPTERLPGETSIQLRARQTKWDQDLHYFKQAADVPPGFSQADVDLVSNLTEQWDMGRPVFMEGRYGWVALFPDSPTSGGMDIYQSGVDSLMRATHVIIAQHQVSMIQDGIRPTMPRHPMVPPHVWDQLGD